MVNHSILISELSNLDISNNVLEWVELYLHDRTQVTMTNSIKPNPGMLECGVSHGSILGPYYFYVNQLQVVLT